MDWVEFGHKFADRNGVVNGDTNERAPVFLQWLDGVHQLVEQNPLAFEVTTSEQGEQCALQFNRTLLVKLAQHTYSSLFGTFLCNSLAELERRQIGTRTLSVWCVAPVTVGTRRQVVPARWQRRRQEPPL